MGNMVEKYTGNRLADFYSPLCPPKGTLRLESGKVHLWWLCLGMDLHPVKYFNQILSLDERKRASSLRFKKHREQFTVTHGILRILLGRYLQIEPWDVRLDYNPFGKPRLDISLANPSLCFNLSHSHELALFGVTGSREIGIDVEFVGTDFNWEGVAKKFFSAREINEIWKVRVNKRQEAFLKYWTCEEAYLKAIGRGHSTPLNQIEILQLDDSPAVLLAV
jgi:4'-phosphopantetheinyl transferase